jgi:hypothetical protein
LNCRNKFIPAIQYNNFSQAPRTVSDLLTFSTGLTSVNMGTDHGLGLLVLRVP